MAGKYGSTSFTASLEDGPGGTARAMVGHILSIGEIGIEALMERSDALNAAFEAQTPTGKKRVPPIEIEGFFDTTASTGPHVVFGTVDDGPQDDGREFIAVFGDSKTLTGDCRLSNYRLIPSNDGLTRFRATLTPTGTWTWS